MEEHYEDFIGIYDESVPVDLCNSFVENWEVAEKNQTLVDCTVENELGVAFLKFNGVDSHTSEAAAKVRTSIFKNFLMAAGATTYTDPQMAL